MRPEGNKACQKSEARKILLKEYGSCVHSQSNPSTKENVVVFLDALQTIYNMPGALEYRDKFKKTTNVDGCQVQVESLITFGEMAKKLRTTVQYYISQFHCLAVIVSFDKQDYVPLAKGTVQTTRDTAKDGETKPKKGKKKGTDEGEDEKKEEYVREKAPSVSIENFVVEDDAQVPSNFREHMSHRDGNRKKIISYLSRNLLCGEHSVSVQRGTILLIDGHCVTWDELIEMPIFERNEEFAYDDIQVYPLSRAIPSGGAGSASVSLIAKYKNNIGEADFTAFFYHREMHKNVLNMTYIIVSTDSDITFLSMMYYEHHRQVHGKEKSKFTILNKYTSGPPVINMNELYWSMYSRYSLELGNKILDSCCPVASLIMSLMVGGCDYTQKHNAITYDTIYATFNADIKRFKELVKFEKGLISNTFYLNPSAYADLILEVHKTKYKDLIDKTSMSAKEIGWGNFNTIFTASKSKVKESKWLPYSPDVIASGLQLCYYIWLISQLGISSLVTFSDGDKLQSFAYKKIDKSKPWSKTNCTKVIINEETKNVSTRDEIGDSIGDMGIIF
jgi:hypothetical protein